MVRLDLLEKWCAVQTSHLSHTLYFVRGVDLGRVDG